MFGDNEIVIFTVNKESWYICLFHVFADRIKVFNFEVVLRIIDLTFSLMVDLRKLMAMPLKMEKPPPCF